MSHIHLDLNIFLQKVEKNTQLWHFKTTPSISSYLFAFIAGPFEKIVPDINYPIPMSLYCRKSLTTFLEKDKLSIFELIVIFLIQAKSTVFFESFFGYPFPFEKYDMIFCPEYN